VFREVVDPPGGMDGRVTARRSGRMWNVVVDGALFGVASLAGCNGLTEWLRKPAV
jgi:hypothetical protein